MQLHEEIGPRATTISAIADRAGVQRLTVYRHFPDETAVFQACTAHWLSLNPPPDPADWAGITDPRNRLRKRTFARTPPSLPNAAHARAEVMRLGE
jgi:AcrR family transcriptional regulator